MAKLGYTWYPKDWGNSENVFELSLSERGLYREIIDLAMMNDNKTEIKLDTWVRKFAVNLDELKSILGKLSILNLIQIDGEKLFVPSCESRLNMVRGGSKGGKVHKPTKKPIVKGVTKPIESLLENNDKPIVNQTKTKIETKVKKENNVIIIDNTIFSNECKISEQWIETIAMQNKIKPEVIKIFIDGFESHLITMQEQKKTVKEFKEHFSYWLKKQDVSTFINKSSNDKPFGKTNQA